MRNYRCYTPQTLIPGESAQLDERSHHHLVNVLRARTGDALTLFNGDGQDYSAKLTETSRRQSTVEVLNSQANLSEAPRQVLLQQAIIKGERMDWLIQKSVELGVHTIQLIHTERSMVNLKGDRLSKRLAHWQGVVISACEQCGRACVPDVLEPLSLDALQLTDSQVGIVLHPAANQSLLQVVDQAEPVVIAIGPEGGFSDAEIALLESAGYQKAKLGNRVLRSETAGIAALSVLNLCTNS